MKEIDRFIRRPKNGQSFRSGDGATVYELFHPKNSIVQNMSLAYGFLDHGQKAIAHYHIKSEEFYYVLGGEGKVVIDKETFAIKAGDAIHIPTNTLHRLLNIAANKNLSVLAIMAPAYMEGDIFFIQ
jgi:mannose-6-phosphate isomerase-like protein (cupin superfamily)